MNEFLKWFAESKIASYLRVFLSIVIAQAVADFARIGSFDFSNIQAWLIAALVATLPVLMRSLNPEDTL